MRSVYKNFPENFPLPFILDGSTGTALTRAGMPSGSCTESYVLEHPDTLRAIQKSYAAAGSDAVYTATFGANAPTLSRHGITEPSAIINRRLCAISSGCAKFIGGDMSPTGLMMQPYGETSFEEIVAVYREQARGLIDAGVDFIAVETQISTAEARAAVVAIRDISQDIPVFVTLTVGENGRTMSGDALIPSLLCFEDLHISAFGCNCSTGPEQMLEAVSALVPYAAAMGIPVIAKPNAGMPCETEHGTEFHLEPEEMYTAAKKLLDAGVLVLGGCCGTTDEHIAAIKKAAGEYAFTPARRLGISELASNSRIFAAVDMDADYNPATDDPDDIADYAEDADEVLYLTVSCDDDADAVIESAPFLSTPIAATGDSDAIARLKRGYTGKIYVK